MKSINKCHHCGATSYKPVIKRDEQGVMNRSGLNRCTGCGLEFEAIDEWRKGVASHRVADGANLSPKPVPT
ncbi:hypothetical protein LHU53_14360 [Rhodoferax sp. U2-2l]|uniref:hypothetical protein n=1 Tax=Rhodoferax sp. U2-2l TaxID=2884000 RepID=UPI001D0A9E47|nr:hypothetical protein [Rhodoferax sp. U2-2l]MCB8748090.1 hypothetical protein [Rhodoferax sp. U2-2l]